MKKISAILAILALAFHTKAQDIYTVGYYNVDEGTVAALYKNGEKLYDAHHTNQTSKATKVTCNSKGDVYWWVNFYDYPEGTYSHSEVRINNHVYATTETHHEIHVSDIYCLNDTIYYTGYQYNEDSVMVAMVWKGEDFATHWVMGDGIHQSYIKSMDVDKQTGIPYFCGYVINDKKRAAIWERQELLSTFEQDSIYEESITYSYASEIAVENGHVYTIGEFEQQGFPIPALWKDNVLVRYVEPYFDVLHGICTFENSYYYGYTSRWQYYDAILKDNNTKVLQLGYAYCILSTLTDIYVIGDEMDYQYYVWKNFEKQYQIESCNAINDACVFEANFLPESCYGFLYQPDTAIVYLETPNNYSPEYAEMYAGFIYNSNGTLNRAYYESYDEYGHWRSFQYDSKLRVIKENDCYFSPIAAPYYGAYIYENDLLKTYVRYFDNYHGDDFVMEDSIAYFYDALKRLDVEKQLKTTYYQSYQKDLYYEYNDREIVITTEGYSDGLTGDWIVLNKETRSFSEDSLLLTKKTEPYNDSATLVTYGYDEQGHRVSALTQKRYNGLWENQKLVQYHFNPYGNLTLAEIKQWEENEWVQANRAVYELNEAGYPAVVTFEKWDGEAWVEGVWQADFYLYNEELLAKQNKLLYDHKSDIKKLEIAYTVTMNPLEPLLPDESEWFYEIENENGAITYQLLKCASDTTINNERPKVIVRSNTHYDRDSTYTEVTHEYIYEKNGKVYWWNKDLEEFTVLYDLAAQPGDSWVIKVGTDSLIMHVDTVENYEYDGRTFRMLHVSDENDFFSGNIVCGIGHQTSFFPEHLMTRGKGFRVDGLRCYWLNDELIYKQGDEDCDAIYAELHHGLDEPMDDTAFAVYPNPANNVLTVAVRLPHCDSPTSEQNKYCITNLMGQTLLNGLITTEKQQINIESLPAGMYFITIDGATQKFVVK